MLDTYRAVETPEGVELGLRVAGPVVRSLAWAMDFLIRGAVVVGLSMVLGVLGAFGSGVFLIALFVLFWFYPVLFEVLRNGATPGKKLFGIQVLHDDGTPIGWTASIIRNLIRFVDFLPFAYGFGLVAMVISRDFKRLGDLAGGTIVVYREVHTFAFKIPAVEPVPPPVPLQLPEQRAIIAYAERYRSWTPARAYELAAVVRPLTENQESERDDANRLLGMAAWLLGRR